LSSEIESNLTDLKRIAKIDISNLIICFHFLTIEHNFVTIMERGKILKRKVCSMKQKERYTLKELYDNLPITMTELSKLSGKSHGTLIRIRNGEPARRSTINKLLIVLSEVYKLELSLDNVTEIVLEERQEKATEKAKKPKAKPAKVTPEKPPKRVYNRKKDTGLPEGAVLATDFARAHGIAPTSFRDHMLIGLGPGTVPGEQGDPMLPVKEQVDYSERDKPGRKAERERYLTPAQQTAALDFWRRHGVAFTMPDTERKVSSQEQAWYLPD
jgi:hypothetical protein